MTIREYEERPADSGRDQLMWDIFSASKRLNWMTFADDDKEDIIYIAEHSTGDCSMWSTSQGFGGSISPDYDYCDNYSGNRIEINRNRVDPRRRGPIMITLPSVAFLTAEEARRFGEALLYAALVVESDAKLDAALNGGPITHRGDPLAPPYRVIPATLL